MSNLTGVPFSGQVKTSGWLPLGAGLGGQKAFVINLSGALHLAELEPAWERLRGVIFSLSLPSGHLDKVNGYLASSTGRESALTDWGGKAAEANGSGLTETRGLVDEQRVVIGQTAEWFPRAFDRLQELMLLPTGWDGEGNPPVGGTVASGAFTLLDRLARKTKLEPSLVPTREGRLQLEWHEATGHLEAEIETGGAVHLWYHDLLDDSEHERTIASIREAVYEIDALVTVLETRS